MKAGLVGLTAVLLGIVLIPRADAAVDLWATGAGGSGNDNGYAIAALPDGSAVVAGAYSGTVSFGSTTLTSTGSRDVFVARTDAAGAWVWAASAGTSGQGDVARAVTVAPDGSALVTGYFRGTMVFAGSTVPSLVSTAQEDVFVARISAAGQWVWATKAGSTTGGGAQGPDVGRGIAALSDGSAIVTGYFQGSATFGSSTVVSAGARDVFVARITAAGAWQWVVRAGGVGDDDGFAVAALPDDQVVVTGDFVGSIAFGGLGTMTSAGSNDVFVVCIDSSGNWVWQTSAGGTGADEGFAISTQPDGHAGVTGSFGSTATFGGAPAITAAGADDIFVAEVDPSGSWTWATGVGDTLSDSGVAIAATSDGNYVLGGSFQGSATFGSFALTSAGAEDAFLAELDRAGSFLWAQRGGGTSFEEIRGVAELPDRSFLAVGDFQGSAVFGATTLVSLGSTEVFVARYADVPGAPRNVTAQPALGQLVVTWDPPAADGGLPVDSYVATASPGGASCTVTAPSTTCTISGLSDSIAYTVVVAATNGAGTGEPSAPSGPVSPTAPAASEVVPVRFAG